MHNVGDHEWISVVIVQLTAVLLAAALMLDLPVQFCLCRQFAFVHVDISPLYLGVG